MFEWWNSLVPLQQIFAMIAVPATIIMVLQTILLLFGMGGDGDADLDTDADFDTAGDVSLDGDTEFAPDEGITDVDPDHIGGLRLFTVRGIVAFFAVGGWVGIAAISLGCGQIWSVIFSLIAGILALLLVAVVFKAAYKLQDNGTLDFANTVGLVGNVYITVPGSMSGSGKINVTVQDQFREFEAMTKSVSPLESGSTVKVCSVLNNGILLVEPVYHTEETVHYEVSDETTGETHLQKDHI